MEKITCPNCDHIFDIENVLAKDIRKELQKDFVAKEKAWKQQIEQEKERLSNEQKEFEEKKKRENELFAQRLEKAKKDMMAQMKTSVQAEFEQKLHFQQNELISYKEKIKSLQQKELEFLQQKRRLDEQLQKKEIELQKQLMEEKERLQTHLRKQLREELSLQLLEKDKKLEDQKKLIQELKRKSEQGSMQLQGEVLEIAIEDYLKNTFPFDKIEEVKKGVRGADVIQTVINNMQQSCGHIVYESKRTKHFSDEWIQKLKADQQKVQADIAVLVTEAMPKDMHQFGNINGVWVCDFKEFKSLCFVLRELLIKTAAARASQQNKGDKKEMLYDYFISEEFKLLLGNIVHSFQKMREDLEREKNAIRSSWKKREKQIEIVTSNTLDLYGSIRSIAGNAAPKIDSLEMPEDEQLKSLE